jgi:hypothetical protein
MNIRVMQGFGAATLFAVGVLVLLLLSPPVNAAIAIDANVSADQSTAKAAVTSPSFSTTSSNELLLAFVETDYLSGSNTTVTGVSGAGLTWVLVVRTNVQSGTSEIWRAFAPSQLSNVSVTATLSQSVVSSITLVSFSGVNVGGTNGSGAIGATSSANAKTGAPKATLVTTQNGSWVFGAGNDYDNAIARTLGTAQSLVHQYLTPTGDTYWVQVQNAPTPASGTSVTINDTAPTGDRYNLSLCEVLPATGGSSSYALSGTVSPAAAGSGATMSLSGAATATVTANSSGSYSFANLANGSYTVTPSKPGYSFSPSSLPETISGANVTEVNFTGTSTAVWNITGTISPSSGGGGALVALSGAATATTTADSSGNYSFTSLANGSYTVTPSQTGYTFSPTSQPVAINGANASGVNFTATSTASWNLTGTIIPVTAGSGAVVTLSGAATGTATADSSGNYSFTNLANGTYTLTPSNSGYAFTPVNQNVTINGANAAAAVFTGQLSSGSGSLALDAQVAVHSTSASSTIKTPSFSTASTNELLLAFLATDYLSGANTTVTGVAGGGLTWSLVIRTNTQSGSSEIWRAFATSPLSNTTVTATLSQKVVASLDVLSFTGADQTGANGSGAIGATKSASAKSGAPTASLVTTRSGSWVFGVGNDYDNAIARTVGPGQSLEDQYLTATGDTYWVQLQNLTAPVVGTTVTINDTAPTADRYNLSIVEVLPATSGTGGGTPPAISMASPAPAAIVTGITNVTANATDTSYPISGVQFLLDGTNLGAQVAAAPYSLTWDTTTATAGTHMLTATVTDTGGLSATATPVTITVDNSGNTAVVGSWSSPVTTPTVAVNLILLDSNKLLFYEDGVSPTLWDYVNNVFTNIPTSADLFCSGQAALADGRILVVGGYGGSSTEIGIANAEIFDPSTNTWTIVPKMAYQRWYPGATPLSDGRILVTAGWQTTNHSNAGIPEIYDPTSNTWTELASANNPFETYPFLFMLGDGRVIHVGGSEYATDTDILNVNSQTWTVVDARIFDGGSATMYLPGLIMKAGSASDSQETGLSSNTTFVLDSTQPSPAWVQTPSMAYPRSFMNLTELPNGTVLATGGETDKNGGNIANAVYAAELWSPATMTWTTMASMHTPREYHSTALLLPDGRVLQSGMGADFGNVPDELSAEFYSPPYLFKGARPTITQAPPQITYATGFFVGTPDAANIQSAVLIRTGAVTHFFDQNTRYVPLTFQQASGGLTLTAPADAYLAPPGYYMLFLVNTNGVPSVAPFVQLQ